MPIPVAIWDDLLRMLNPAKWGSLAKSEGILPAAFAARGNRWATARAGLISGAKAGVGGYATFGLPMAIFSGAMAPRFHKASAMAGASVPFLGMAIGTAFGGGIGGLVGGFVLDPLIQTTVGNTMQRIADYGRNNPRLQTGGDYQDTEQNYTMRQVAASEMSRSMLNARQYLGKESAFLHS